MRVLITVSMLFLLPATGLAATWYVDDDNTTGPWLGTMLFPFQFIQSGINAAAAGDTVLVMPGTYKENIDFLGRAITVKSDQGAWLTTIDGGFSIVPGVESTVLFWSGEGPNSVLDGFTITNGKGTLINSYQYCGGGIYCDFDSSPTIKNNVVTENAVNAFGGGIYCNHNAYPTIVRNTVKNNFSGDDGAGISCWSSAKVSDNLVMDNITQAAAGGIDCISGGSAPIIMNNIIIRNVAQTGDAGGIRCTGNSTPTITNNTVVENWANGHGGGILIFKSTPTITNTIVWDNLSMMGSNEIWGTGTVMYCDVKGGYPGPGNINVNPLFVGGGDYHLTANSPCIDAGDNTALSLPGNDFEGDPRCCDVPAVPDTGLGPPPITDMGADEFHRHLYYTGIATPGGTVQVKIVGLPGTAPVGLVIGFSTFNPPLPSMFGPWHVAPPWIIVNLPPVPGNGVHVIPGILPMAPPGPYTLYLQTLVGSAMTNLCVMNVL